MPPKWFLLESAMLQNLISNLVLILLDLTVALVTADHSFFFWSTFFHLALRNAEPPGFPPHSNQSDPFRKDFSWCHLSGFSFPQRICQSYYYDLGATHDLPPSLISLISPFLFALPISASWAVPPFLEHSSFLLQSLCFCFSLWIKCCSLKYSLAPYFNSLKSVFTSLLLSKVFLATLFPASLPNTILHFPSLLYFFTLNTYHR